MKRFKKLGILLSIAFLLSSPSLFAQAGGSAVPFLSISPDARSSGMGEIGTAIADDINAIFWNPAGLGFLNSFESGEFDFDKPAEFRQVALSFSPWLPQFNADLYYSYGTYGQYFEELDGTVALNFIFMNLGEFVRTYEDGTQGQPFISNEFSFGLAYGTIVATDFSVGIQLRYIQSNLTPTSQFDKDAGVGRSVSFDLGLLWKPLDIDLFGIEDRLSLGMNLQHLGPQVTYRAESDPLPTTLRLGTAFRLYEDDFNHLKWGLDVSKLLIKRDELGPDPLPVSLWTAWENPGVEIATGMEYWYEHVFALRFGYFTEPSALGNRQYYNFGAGVRYDMFRLDFSFINTVEENHPLANTMRFSLLIDWE